MQDPSATALQALGWVLGDGERAERFLALTGLTPDELRAGLGDPAVQRAVLEFLCGHEADLIMAAEALGMAPATLAATRERL
jgi:adenine/guanine phosphoribosyltransferase-like PRPP-binding protein